MSWKNVVIKVIKMRNKSGQKVTKKVVKSGKKWPKSGKKSGERVVLKVAIKAIKMSGRSDRNCGKKR